jgi:hypothetical protein
MSSPNQTLHAKSREVLLNLLNDLQPIIDEHVKKIPPETLKFILTNYGNALKLDLKRDFVNARHNSISGAAFGDLLTDLQDLDNNDK